LVVVVVSAASSLRDGWLVACAMLLAAFSQGAKDENNERLLRPTGRMMKLVATIEFSKFLRLIIGLNVTVVVIMALMYFEFFLIT
jgi:hypothetical protein